MAGPETLSDKPKPDAAKTSASVDDAASYVGTPAVGTSKAAAAAGLATVGPKDSEVNNRRRRLVWCAVTAFLGAWFIAYCVFSCRVRCSSLPPSSRSVIPPITRSALTPNGSRNFASGSTAHPTAFSSSTRAARILAARPIGKPAKTNSSAPATAAATTAKA